MKPSMPVPSYGKATTYRGVEFRSQIEARWAAVFDLMKAEWEYEPAGPMTFPDFKLDADWVEVKSLSMSDSSEWAQHGDARKARASFAAAGLVCGRGGHLIVAGYGIIRWFLGEGVAGGLVSSVAQLELREAGLSHWSNAGSLAGQEGHYWSRALVMVSGRGKE